MDIDNKKFLLLFLLKIKIYEHVGNNKNTLSI